MKSNAELKKLAWQRLWTDRWFSRIFGGCLLLGLCGNFICSVVAGVLQRLHVQTWADYNEAVIANRATCTVPIPNLTPDYVLQTTSATVFQWFFIAIVSGIAAYGFAVIRHRCLANDEKGWLRAAFGGFSAPFEMCWLFVRQTLIRLGWMLPPVFVLGVIAGACWPLLKRLNLSDSLDLSNPSGLVILGVVIGLFGAVLLFFSCVPFYRYRYLWLIKAEHPTWSSGRCLRACRTLMRGNMMKAVRLDCSYWKPITFALLLLAIICGGLMVMAKPDTAHPLLGIVCLVSGCVLIVTLLVTWQYIAVGQAFLYQELRNLVSLDDERAVVGV